MSSKVKVLRSTVAGKRPTGHEFGELWVNDKDKVMGYIDSAGQPVVPFALPSDIVIHKFSATTAYKAGDVVLGPDNNLWSAKAAIPAGAWDATKWNHSGDGRFVKLAGDTMTGALNLPTGVPAGNNAVSRAEGDKLYVNVAGDTMTGALNLPTDGLSVGTDQIKIVGGKVGIGTANPTVSKVVIEGNAVAPNVFNALTLNNASGGGVALIFDNSISAPLGSIEALVASTGAGGAAADCDMAFGVSKAGVKQERMRLDANGNLGFGLTPNRWSTNYAALEMGLAGNALFSGKSAAYHNIILAQNTYYDGAMRYGYAAPAAHYEMSDGEHRWHTAPSGTAGAPMTFKRMMTLDVNGGLTIPSALTSSAVVVSSTTPADNNIRYYQGTVAEWWTGMASGSNAFRFGNGSGVGNTVAQIDHSGDLTISGANATKAGAGGPWLGASDVRLKDNIQPFTKGLNEILRVDVKTWEYNGKGGTVAGMKGLGVIADEVMQVLPDTVDTYSAKLTPDDEEEIDIKRFNGNEITWLLVNSIKEQQALITDLQTRLAALEAKP